MVAFHISKLNEFRSRVSTQPASHTVYFHLGLIGFTAESKRHFNHSKLRRDFLVKMQLGAESTLIGWSDCAEKFARNYGGNLCKFWSEYFRCRWRNYMNKRKVSGRLIFRENKWWSLGAIRMCHLISVSVLNLIYLLKIWLLKFFCKSLLIYMVTLHDLLLIKRYALLLFCVSSSSIHFRHVASFGILILVKYSYKKRCSLRS